MTYGQGLRFVTCDDTPHPSGLAHHRPTALMASSNCLADAHAPTLALLRCIATLLRAAVAQRADVSESPEDMAVAFVLCLVNVAAAQVLFACLFTPRQALVCFWRPPFLGLTLEPLDCPQF